MNYATGGCGCVCVLMMVAAAIGAAATQSAWGLLVGPVVAIPAVAVLLWNARKDP